MGISQEEIPAKKVTIEKEDGTLTIIENPSVLKVKMQGQISFQISGETKEESKEIEISQKEIKAVIEKTGCSEKEAREKLEQTKDLVQAILELS